MARILDIAREQLQLAQRSGDAGRDALVDARRELHDQTQQMFQNLWASQDFEQLADLNQLAQPLAVRQLTHEMELSQIQALVRMLDSPYFARIDMRFDDGGDTEQVYIGRATLKDRITHEIHVHDWRSPIAGAFYRFGVGPAHYDAPAGRITGDILLKRQYEIRRGELSYFFDADVQIQDEFLRQLLSKSASPRMKAIVETIQRDQDAAIRDMDHELLMVQGAAGSGKTSIALHRAAYLMYDGLSTRLSANNILILSPNPLFERYIESVLPELGERSVASATYERMLESLLGAPVQPRTARFDAMCEAEPQARSLMRAALAFKGSEAFARILDRFVAELPRRWIDFQDVCYAGRTIVARQQLKMRILASDGAVPLGVQLLRMEQSLWDGIRERRPARMDQLRTLARHSPVHALEVEAFARACSIFESAALRRHIRRFTHLDCRALYRALVSDERRFRALASGIELPAQLAELLRATRNALDDGAALPLEDASAIAYLQMRAMGAANRSDIRHVVVDEAQDYGPLPFALLGRLFPRARFTVLGDVNQALGGAVDASLYGRIESALNRRSAALVELTKSFRCTGEILRFALRFLGPGVHIDCFSRGGDEPRVLGGPDVDGLIAAEVARCRERGHQSIALIAKTAHASEDWHARLAQIPDLQLIDGASEPRGAFVIPLALSKGLEFDAVLVLDADRVHYGEPEDALLLYVACTRALHDLALLHSGDPSPHLPGGEEERA